MPPPRSRFALLLRTTRWTITALQIGALAAWLWPAAAAADVWGYVDAEGHPHVASAKLDDRYQLFYRGPDAEASGTQERLPEEVQKSPANDTSSVSKSPARGGAAEQASRYEHLIEQHASRHDVDPALVKAIVAVESGFQPRAISPKGARGLMQVMPETAARYGVAPDRRASTEQKLLDPALNLQVGTRYLRDLLARFAQNVPLALAAYNAGEMAVERHRNRVPPYPETVEYVRRVQALYAAFRPADEGAQASAPTGAHRVRGTLQPRGVAHLPAGAPSNPVVASDAPSGSVSLPVL